MPYKNPEDRIKNKREYRKKNLEKCRKWAREWARKKRMENPELMREKRRKWEKANPERLKELQRLSYQRHKEKRRKDSREYHQKNREKRLDYAKKYSEKNSERIKITQKAYRESENGKKVRCLLQKIRHAKRMRTKGNFDLAAWKELIKKVKGICPCCKEYFGDKLTVDHKKPVSRGGTDDISNIQPLCGLCNMRKYTKEIDYLKLFESSDTGV